MDVMQVVRDVINYRGWQLEHLDLQNSLPSDMLEEPL